MKKIMTVGFAVLVLLAVLAMPATAQTLVQEQKIIQAVPAADYNGAAPTGCWVSVKNYGHVQFVVQCGVINASAVGITCTVQQASAVAGTGAKALIGGISNYWVHGARGDIYTNKATTISGFDVTEASDYKTYILEIDTSALDAANSFDCLRLNADTASAHSQILNAFYILSKPRYTGDAESQPSALTN
jgi:hypothetical protein